MSTEIRTSNRGRVMVAKVGLDGHDRGAKVLSRMLREEGFEVIYIGVRHTPEQVAKFALQERVDVVGLSLLSGAHVELGDSVRRALNDIGLAHVPVTIGGLIPRADAEALNAAGISKCFHPGENSSDPERVAEELDRLIEQSRQNAPAILKAPP